MKNDNVSPESRSMLNNEQSFTDSEDNDEHELSLTYRAGVLAALVGVVAGCESNSQNRNTGKTTEPLSNDEKASDSRTRAQMQMMPPPSTGTPGAPASPAPGTPAMPGAPGAGTPGTGMPGGAGATASPGIAPALGDARTFSIVNSTAVLTANMMVSQTMADGQVIPVWGFGNGFNDDRIAPGPVIEVVEGAAVAITLSSMMPHTIHFHGLDVDTPNDGVPLTSGFVAMMTPMNGFGRVADYVNLGSTYVYNFIAPHAGTYMYHCHVDTVLHMEMGMAGAVIVRPADGNNNTAWLNGPAFDKEYVWHLHTMDSRWHNLMVSGPETVRYRPDYFMINGRDGALLLDDTTTAISGISGETILIRGVNIGNLPALIRFGGLSFEVIASDGRPLAESISVTVWKIAAGERYDILLTLPEAGVYEATVDYFNIRNIAIIGTAQTQITSL